MSRTSSSQFEVMVEYMESNGDLNKFADGPNGRITAHNKWTELIRVLNMDTTGSSKPVEKWKKVWSDLKNNTKRKAAKIHRSASVTGGGPACRLILTDLEQRVLNLTGTQAATGLISIPEVGVETTSAEWDTLQQQQQVPPPPPQYCTPPRENIHIEDTTDNENRPGTSQEQVEFDVEEIEGGAVSPTPHHALPSPRRIGVGARRVIRARRTSPRHRRTRPVDAASLFAGTEERWQNFATEFATEHIRLRERELEQRERELEQRERELEQQSQWQTLFGKLLNILENFIKNLK